LKKSLTQLIKFALVGVMNTLISLGIIYLLMNLFHMDYRVSNVIGYLAGLINSFIWNRNWTFKSQGHPVKEITLFILVFGISYGLQFLFLNFLVQIIELNPNLAQPTAMIVYTLINFILNKTITFQNKEKTVKINL
jgi:putative flippase GtrA